MCSSKGRYDELPGKEIIEPLFILKVIVDDFWFKN